jgi:transcriptional regulator with XRE-family HTH domain
VVNDQDKLWLSRLDKLKAILGTDKEVAQRLRVNKQTIANFRAGHQDLPGHAKAALMIELGLPIETRDYIALFPEKDRDAARGVESLEFSPEDKGKSEPGFWPDLILLLKTRFEVGSDAELARKLGLSRSNLSWARTGKGRPSPRTKFVLLDKAGYVVTRDLLIDLLPRKTAARLRGFDNLRLGKSHRRAK